jgi:cellulose biosynthesis protein BcsQ
LDEKKKPTKQLKKLLTPLAADYDVIFLDCPPSISLLSEAIFEAADALLSPIIPTTLSLRTLDQLQAVIVDKQLSALTLIPFFSMVDKRKKMHCDIMARLSETYPATLKSVIPYASDIERMGLEQCPLAVYSRKKDLINTYQDLWQEILTALPIP